MSQAGLFSAVTSAFIIEINSELKPDPNEETAAIVRFLVYQMYNATSGNDKPTMPPQWTGPPRTIVRVQAILFASLAASLFSAFLAMLGKQWLNRYASVDMRGSAIERSQHRQQKLDGIISWYFNYVIQLIPVMLQVALLLLGGALSRYFWHVSTTVASVVLGVTSFGLLFYLLIAVVGVASPSFPYQTPAAHILRHIPRVLGVLRSIILPRARKPLYWRILVPVLDQYEQKDCVYFFMLFLSLLSLPMSLFMHLFSIVCSPEIPHIKLPRLHFQSEQQTPVLDLHCISWILQKSLDGSVRLLALNYLATLTQPDFDPTLVANCFNVLFGCVKITNGSVVINQGSEELAMMSALCFLHTLSHLKIEYPPSRSLNGIREQYTKVFRPETNFDSLPFSHTLGAIHRVFYPIRPGQIDYMGIPIQKTLYTWSVTEVQRVRWESYTPSSDEHVIVACALTRLARFEGWRREGKVARWLLRFALHSLSQDPQPPVSIIVNCLTIIAIDLGCRIPNPMTSDDRYIYI